MTRVLVTGASRGIGRAVAERLRRDGHTCVGTARHRPTQPTAFPIIDGDQGDTALADRVVAHAAELMGGIDALVLNAGIVDDDLAVSLDAERFARVIDVNLTGSYALARAALTRMVRSGGGRIVVISSTAAFTGGAGQSAYAASKAGLVGMARSLALEGARRRVTVNVVAPGLITTDMTEALPARVRADVVQTVPMRREGTADEVAAAVQFFLGPGAEYITGSILSVDGGMGMGL